ncbi:MAG: alpha-glucosidase [Oceanospirillaceae bacterium]|nr:alpha-glucosidase [Oceanospirillaceae bacterium]
MSTRPDNWWKSATAYQIYPRSFCDSNGDGIGDIPGIISKLDYLAELGVGFIWLSPVYRSPMADNGYDISDYQDIAPEFGTLADFDRLLAGARERGIGIVMDLVVNHSSDEHPWFIESRASRDSAKRDYYIWRDPAADGGPPSDLQSFFGGPAWTLDEATGQYYLHLFDRKQPDLNWENPALRQAIWKMMNWWLDRGVAGFRMDVIDLIGKEVDKGIVADGPRLHEYLQEMHRETLAGRDVVTVGEAWSASTDNALLYCGRDRDELSMVFQFEHVTQQHDEKLGKWKPKPFDLVALKRVLNKWQAALAEDGWNSLFWGNHDLPRAVSKYGDDKVYRVESAKMLATVLHLMKGTPYIYQGEEFGMTNAAFSDISQFKDLETLNFYRLQVAEGVSPEAFIAGANENSRDNARTPVQWSDAPQAGFTTGTPWIDINPNYREINADQAVRDPESIFAHYRSLAGLRCELPVIVNGDYRPWFEEHPQVFAYSRHLDGQTLTVVANFSDRPLQLDVPEAMRAEGRGLIANYDCRDHIGATLSLQPYEAFAVLS